MVRTFAEQWSHVVDQLKAKAEEIGVPADQIEKGQTGKQAGARPYVRVFMAPSPNAVRTGRGRATLRQAELTILCAGMASADVAVAVETGMELAGKVFAIVAEIDNVLTNDDAITIIDATDNGARLLIELDSNFQWPA